MLNENLHLTLLIAFSLVGANIIATAACLGFTPQLARVAFVQPNILVPIILPVLMLASFQARFSFSDLYVMLAFGALGLFMKTYGWPRPPIIIAIVLADIIERFYFIAWANFGWGMFGRVPFLLIILVTVGTGLYTLWMQRSVARNAATAGLATEPTAVRTTDDTTTPPPGPVAPPSSPPSGAELPTPPRHTPFVERLLPTPDGIFIALLAVVFGYFLIAGFGWPRGAAFFPQSVSAIGLLLVLAYATMHLLWGPSETKSRILDIGRMVTDAEQAVVMRRTIKAVGTTIGLVAGIVLFGFQVAIPIYVVLYLKIFGKVRWWQALLAGGGFILLFWLFFDRLLRTRWPETLLDRLLGL